MKNKITDIAKAAGVSIATVSRALNNKGPVHEDTRLEILEIAKRMNYRRNTIARSLSTQKTETIGLILPELVDDFYTTIIRGIDKEAFEAKRYLMVSSSHSQRETMEALLEFMGNGRVDGVILMAPMIYQELPSLLKKKRLPVVTINTGNHPDLVSFNIDNYQGAFAMTEHFIKGHGFTKLGIIRGPEGSYDADERFRGFHDAITNNGLKLDKTLAVHGDFTHNSGFYAFSRLMSQQEKPEAIFTSNDMMAIGAYEAAKSMNIKIPQDVAIGGFDDIRIGGMITPQLTTVHIPIEELGIRAFRHLMNMISGEVSQKKRHYEEVSTGLLIRESCGCKILT